ncbi:glutathione S-transferase [Capsaspora owczarzaki ATCC 30864]|uniref:Glutathione S-transferase n=2 Tax=Capsaspora owczarzaki (strain ATCC 30864) TaxID=595528 RepID=A0A0D2UPU4_CAPO3|nr:glutathione S-transferase [Capsaspora owczarzaki ATCC 30864]
MSTASTTNANATATTATSTTSKAHTALAEVDQIGAFKRTASSFRRSITADGSGPDGLKAEAGRYHLYGSAACPWNHRTLIVRALKGLEGVVGYTNSNPVWQRTSTTDNHRGWVFSDKVEHPFADSPAEDNRHDDKCDSDPFNGAKSIRDLYLLSDPKYAGKFTVPVLWDTKTKTVVNNESSEICRMLNSEFNAFAKYPEIDLYPAKLRDEINSVNEWVYDKINDGVYKAGFAQRQGAYTVAVNNLFEALERVEGILAKSRFLVGDRVTEADVRLVTTLFRFDPVYTIYFKCSKKQLREFPNLYNYCRDMYQLHGVGATVNETHIKNHYYCSHPTLNPYRIVPETFPQDWNLPHNRALLSAKGPLRASSDE